MQLTNRISAKSENPTCAVLRLAIIIEYRSIKLYAIRRCSFQDLMLAFSSFDFNDSQAPYSALTMYCN
jgi:hypothetical protein